MTLMKLGEEVREGELHADAQEDAQETAGEAQEERLDEVDLDDLSRVGAEGLHDGDGVEALGEMGAHGHGDADGAEDEGDEAHEGEQAGGLVEAGGEGGVGFAVVGDLGFGEELDEASLEVRRRRRRRWGGRRWGR